MTTGAKEQDRGVGGTSTRRVSWLAWSLAGLWWRPLAWLSGAVIVLLSVGIALAPGPLENPGGVRDPFGLEEEPWVTVAAYVVLPLLPLCMLASALSLVLRYRRSGGEERQQIKWIAFAASVVGLAYLVASFAFPVGAWSTGVPVLKLNLLTCAALLSFTGILIATGFAILKHGLYDIDVIKRTLVYGSLTTMLVAVYFGGVATTQAIVRALTGQEQQPQLAIVISTLAIAALFIPLRHNLQGLIDPRFYRNKYDARKTLEAFSAGHRDETDLQSLGEHLVGAVGEAVQRAIDGRRRRPAIVLFTQPPRR